ncbi:MAG: cob(I)yrinic acid a,c-diamide adenosyltransferase [Lewinellaceae bacterium]|nr:cob(I)yrinic acid a,c-diamide adenosyltransferase [Lewinellaceae bacterium]
MGFKIYTKTGDQGETSLFGGRRLAKDHIRIESYGTVDELNAHLGFLRDNLTFDAVRAEIRQIQDLLFSVGANLASDPEKSTLAAAILASDIEYLEHAMDRMDEQLPELRNFIIPGGHPAVSACHIARCVCRRAERLVVSLAQAETVAPLTIQFLNRLSDYLFVLSRYLAKELEVNEVVWRPRPLA